MMNLSFHNYRDLRDHRDKLSSAIGPSCKFSLALKWQPATYHTLLVEVDRAWVGKSSELLVVHKRSPSNNSNLFMINLALVRAVYGLA